MEHGLKDIAFLCSKTYDTLHSCHNFPAGSRQAARGASVCETSLLFFLFLSNRLWYLYFRPYTCEILLEVEGANPPTECKIWFHNCRDCGGKNIDGIVIFNWSLIQGSADLVWYTVKSLNIRCIKSQNLIFLVSSCSCLCAIYWSQVSSRKWT